MRAAGAQFESTHTLLDIFAQHVVVDGRLITGQNQNAGIPTAQAMMRVARALADAPQKQNRQRVPD